jgi:triosephosphate isomerase
MAKKPRPLIVGNWKMNGLRQHLGEVSSICTSVAEFADGEAEIVVCPPATLLAAAARLCEGYPVTIGGQDCHVEPSGPFTGDISAEMLKDAGASYVILGQSERRYGHAESNEIVCKKAAAAFRAGLKAIVCVGETTVGRKKGDALAAVGLQLAGSIPKGSPPECLVISYEPLAGLTPTRQDIVEMHRFIRSWINEHRVGLSDEIRVLYGGSVNPADARALMGSDDVDGALVYGASLSANDFLEIAGICR